MSLPEVSPIALAAALSLFALPADAASGETQATYRVVLDATWSPSTHPGAYPASAHFSPLIGATHNSSVSFWGPGQTASPGIESMAETGSQSPLNSEINAAVSAGTAGQLVTDGFLIFSPGQSADAFFTVTDEHPLFSMVTMIAPSPDWFVGVHDLSLLQGGEWVDGLVVDLYAYDAGTDSGPNFTSGNANTNPQDPIALMTGGPFFGATPLATFTFTRLESTLAYGCGVNPTGSLTIESGRPKIGTTMQVAVSDPTGTMVSPSATFLALSVNPSAAFPCGTLVPNWGMSGIGADGEFLLQNTQFLRFGSPYSGSPVSFTLQIPNDPMLISRNLYLQGMLIDSTKRRGLTNPLELHVGPNG